MSTPENDDNTAGGTHLDHGPAVADAGNDATDTDTDADADTDDLSDPETTSPGNP